MPRRRQSVSTVDRLAARVRAKILSGELAPGSRLPPTPELARQWKSYVPAVQGALARLAREGLLDRRRCLGTFVRERGEALSRVGILAAAQMWDDQSGFYFHRQVFMALHDILAARGVHTTVWFEHRRDEKTRTPLPAVIRAVRQEEIQGVIALNADIHSAGWLSELPVPVTGMEKHLPHHVQLNPASFFELAAGRLRAEGCRTAGLISPLSSSDLEFYRPYRQALDRNKLDSRVEWTRADRPYPQSMEQFGYDQFLELWSQEARPDGLIVFPDVAARGALLAVSTLGVKVPRDIKLVFQRNVEVPFTCPLPVSFVDNSCRACAVALIGQLELLHRGRPCPVRPVEYTLAVLAPRGRSGVRKRRV